MAPDDTIGLLSSSAPKNVFHAQVGQTALLPLTSDNLKEVRAMYFYCGGALVTADSGSLVNRGFTFNVRDSLYNSLSSYVG